MYIAQKCAIHFAQECGMHIAKCAFEFENTFGCCVLAGSGIPPLVILIGDQDHPPTYLISNPPIRLISLH